MSKVTLKASSPGEGDPTVDPRKVSPLSRRRLATVRVRRSAGCFFFIYKNSCASIRNTLDVQVYALSRRPSPVSASKFSANPLVQDFGNMLTVQDMCRYVESKLATSSS